MINCLIKIETNDLIELSDNAFSTTSYVAWNGRITELLSWGNMKKHGSNALQATTLSVWGNKEKRPPSFSVFGQEVKFRNSLMRGRSVLNANESYLYDAQYGVVSLKLVTKYAVTEFKGLSAQWDTLQDRTELVQFPTRN
jgi:hypothetical protein